MQPPERPGFPDQRFDPGFGFEAVRLGVTAADPLVPRQTGFTLSAAATREQQARLTDALRQRLGSGSVRRLRPVESHIPEQAVLSDTVDDAPSAWPPSRDLPLRPPLLLPKAEPAEDVVAVVPDGPPQRFRWRKSLHWVSHTQGPERIAAEWWRERQPKPTRDYYIVEDEAGRRFWLFREGLYGREASHPRWAVHGFFP